MNGNDSIDIDYVVKSLLCGFNKPKRDFEKAKVELLWYQAANQLSLAELNELCWEDSTIFFDLIYG